VQLVYARTVVLGPDIVHEDDEVRIATWSIVLASRWHATPSKQKLELLGRQQRALAESTVDRRIVVLTVLASGAGLMLTNEARNAAEAVAKAGREYVAGLAQVVEGEGFMAATARAVMSGIQLAVRARYPTKVFGTVDEALPWVAELLRKAGHERDADEVASALRPVIGPAKGR
jgi:hypothetical protein